MSANETRLAFRNGRAVGAARALDNGPAGSGLDKFLALPAEIVPGAADCSFSFSAFSMERVANGDVAV